jgi:hypothetical protein
LSSLPAKIGMAAALLCCSNLSRPPLAMVAAGAEEAGKPVPLDFDSVTMELRLRAALPRAQPRTLPWSRLRVSSQAQWYAPWWKRHLGMAGRRVRIRNPNRLWRVVIGANSCRS